jgi:hypothetical protein
MTNRKAWCHAIRDTIIKHSNTPTIITQQDMEKNKINLFANLLLEQFVIHLSTDEQPLAEVIFYNLNACATVRKLDTRLDLKLENLTVGDLTKGYVVYLLK